MVPKRRFKAFENEDGWVQHELGEVSEVFDGTHQTPKYMDSGVKFVSVENIYTLETEKYISEAAYSKEYSNKQAEKGDVLMTRIGDIGTAKVIKNDELLAYYVTLALLKPKGLDSNFLSNTISSPTVQSNIWRRTLHIAFPKKINLGEINQIEMFVPNIDEQRKIGELFSKLDQTITLQQQKLEKLKAMKSAYLSEMFPAEGERKPKRRFPGFTDDWEQRYFLNTLKTIVDFRGRTPKKLGMEWSDSGYLALSALNVKKGYIDFAEVAHYGNQELYDKWMSGKELYQGQVLFTTEAPMGNVAQVPDGKGYILSQRTIAFNIDETLLTDDFLYVLLGSPRIFDDLSALSSGGTAKGVSQKSLEQLKVHIPKDLDEQKQIGIFFKNLDQTIILQQEKLEKLQNIKKAYLNEMFI